MRESVHRTTHMPWLIRDGYAVPRQLGRQYRRLGHAVTGSPTSAKPRTASPRLAISARGVEPPSAQPRLALAVTPGRLACLSIRAKSQGRYMMPDKALCAF